jgi:hypothetical protein
MPSSNSSVHDSIPYPFPEGEINLKTNPLTGLQRQWIVQQVDSRAETSYSLAWKLGCASHYIRTLVSRRRKGKYLRGKNGRPPAFDEESMATIRAKLDATGEIIYEQAVELLKEEYINSFARTFPAEYQKLSNTRKRPKLPRGTRDKYLNILFPGIRKQGADEDPLSSSWVQENVADISDWVAEL